MKQALFFFGLLVSTSLCSAADLHAQPSPGSEYADVSLFPAHDVLQTGSSSEAGLRFDLADGWHTYWQNPGDSGIPAGIEWDAPEGFQFEAVKWPYPAIFREEHLITHGYKDETMLLIPFSVTEGVAPGSYEITASLEYLVCDDVCLPAFETHAFTIEISGQESRLNEQVQDTFDRFRAKIPKEDHTLDAAFTADGDQVILRLQGEGVPAEQALRSIHFFPHEDDVIEPSAEQKAVYSDGDLWLELKTSRYRSSPPNVLNGALVIETDEGVKAVVLSVNR